MSIESCVYCAQGEPPPTFGYRATCRACGREYLAPFPSHGKEAGGSISPISPISPIRPIPTPPVYHYQAETQLGPRPKPAAPPPRPAPAGPQFTMELD